MAYMRRVVLVVLMVTPVVALLPCRRVAPGRRGVVTMSVGNSWGRLFRISTWGESHGGGVGVTVDGCPPRLPISVEEIQLELTRRRPGQSRLTTPRDEEDKVNMQQFLSQRNE